MLWSVMVKRTVARTVPCRAKVVYWPVLYTPSSSKWPMLTWMLPWSFAGISLLVHELHTDKRVSMRKLLPSARQAQQGGACSVPSPERLRLPRCPAYGDAYCDSPRSPPPLLVVPHVLRP